MEYYEYLYIFNHFTDYYSDSGHRCYLYDFNRYHGMKEKKSFCSCRMHPGYHPPPIYEHYPVVIAYANE